MNEQMFALIKMILEVILFAFGVWIAPTIKKWVLANTTKEQREDAVFWAKLAIRAAEEIYKKQGQGKLKKEYVVQWLNDNKIPISEQQLSLLIDNIVSEFNKHGWDELVATK